MPRTSFGKTFLRRSQTLALHLKIHLHHFLECDNSIRTLPSNLRGRKTVTMSGEAEVVTAAWRLVERGRVVLFNTGPFEGKLGCIAEIIDHKRVRCSTPLPTIRTSYNRSRGLSRTIHESTEFPLLWWSARK